MIDWRRETARRDGVGEMMRRLRWLWLLAAAGCYFETPTHLDPEYAEAGESVDQGDGGGRADSGTEADGSTLNPDGGTQPEPVDAGMDATVAPGSDSGTHDSQVKPPEDTGTAVADTGMDAQRPECACDAGKTVCVPATGMCVECTATSNTCSGDKPVCDVASSTCVACNGDVDCKSAGKAKCDLQSHSCVMCDAKMQCMHINGLPVCSGGACVQCNGSDVGVCATTPAKPLCQTNGTTCVACNTSTDCTDPTKPFCEANACRACAIDSECAGKMSGATALDACYMGQCVDCKINTSNTKQDIGCTASSSCNPATRTCTGKAKGTIGICAPCLADAECVDGHRCITMNYQGVEVKPGGTSGGFCLQRTGSGPCNRPYGAPAITRISRSGAAIDSYCGVNESVATCDATRTYAADCASPSSCDIPEGRDALGARCETVTGSQRCTYRCSSGNSSECPSNSTCPAAGTNSYCQ